MTDAVKQSAAGADLPRKSVGRVAKHAEIASFRDALRTLERPKDEKGARDLRPHEPADETLATTSATSVTISSQMDGAEIHRSHRPTLTTEAARDTDTETAVEDDGDDLVVAETAAADVVKPVMASPITQFSAVLDRLQRHDSRPSFPEIDERASVDGIADIGVADEAPAFVPTDIPSLAALAEPKATATTSARSDDAIVPAQAQGQRPEKHADVSKDLSTPTSLHPYVASPDSTRAAGESTIQRDEVPPAPGRVADSPLKLGPIAGERPTASRTRTVAPDAHGIAQQPSAILHADTNSSSQSSVTSKPTSARSTERPAIGDELVEQSSVVSTTGLKDNASAAQSTAPDDGTVAVQTSDGGPNRARVEDRIAPARPVAPPARPSDVLRVAADTALVGDTVTVQGSADGPYRAPAQDKPTLEAAGITALKVGDVPQMAPAATSGSHAASTQTLDGRPDRAPVADRVASQEPTQRVRGNPSPIDSRQSATPVEPNIFTASVQTQVVAAAMPSAASRVQSSGRIEASTPIRILSPRAEAVSLAGSPTGTVISPATRAALAAPPAEDIRVAFADTRTSAGGSRPYDPIVQAERQEPAMNFGNGEPTVAVERSRAEPTAAPPASQQPSVNATAVTDAVVARLEAPKNLESLPQLMLRLSQTSNTEIQSLKIQLHPGELGVVTAHLSMTGQQLSVELEVQNADAYQRMKLESDVIAKSLSGLGFDIDKVSIQPHGAQASRIDNGIVAPQPDGQSRGDGFFQASDSSSGQSGAGGRSREGEHQNGGRQADGSTPVRAADAGSGLYI